MLEISLLPGNYFLTSFTEENFFLKSNLLYKRFDIVGGDVKQLIVGSTEITPQVHKNNDKKITSVGTVYEKDSLYKALKTEIEITNTSAKIDGNKEGKFRVFLKNKFNEPQFFLNGKEIEVSSTTQNNYYPTVILNEGANEIEVKIIGIDGFEITKKISAYVLTENELEQNKIAKQNAEKKRIEDERLALIKKVEEERISRLKKEEEERLNRIKYENELKARIAEQKRIEKEGDGTPDDLSCKKYGLKLGTQGYAECRMRLDLARQESQRENQRLITQEKLNQEAIRKLNADRERARERAKQDELQRQYDEIEAQNAIVRNRESKCLFVKSQEYLRPALGGFFESMNRANSAYENCMAGVPQINTTCTKDGIGNISCTSR